MSAVAAYLKGNVCFGFRLVCIHFKER